MLVTLTAFLLTLSQFGTDAIETDLVELQSDACFFFFSEADTTTEVVELVTGDDAELGEPEQVEVVEADEDKVDVELKPATEEEIVATSSKAPETVVEEDEVVVQETVVAESKETSVKEVSAAWPHLSEEARQSIMLLIEIDMNAE